MHHLQHSRLATLCKLCIFKFSGINYLACFASYDQLFRLAYVTTPISSDSMQIGQSRSGCWSIVAPQKRLQQLLQIFCWFFFFFNFWLLRQLLHSSHSKGYTVHMGKKAEHSSETRYIFYIETHFPFIYCCVCYFANLFFPLSFCFNSRALRKFRFKNLFSKWWDNSTNKTGTRVNRYALIRINLNPTLILKQKGHKLLQLV